MSRQPPIRVLLCEDSRTYAAGLRRLLEHGGSIEVVGVSESAEAALEALPKLRPDLVTMDVELPGMSGLEAVEQIMASRPLPILVLSSYASRDSETAVAALAAGALDAISKDDVDLLHPGGAGASALRRRVELLSRARVIRHPRARLTRPRRVEAAGKAAVIGICASTGGPQALAVVLRALPASFPVPVLVVQHISAGFGEGLAHWLDGAVPLPVRIVTRTTAAAPGIWLAPDGQHLELGPRGRLVLDRATVAGLHRPSGDVLLASLARVAGAAAVGVVLSGMGRDGAAGARGISEAGGLVLVQDEDSSAVYGMPKAAAEESGAERLAPEELAARLAALEHVPLEDLP